MTTIKFWSTTGEYGSFSNFSKHSVVIGQKRYKTTEHFYQAQKFISTDPLYANKIAKASTPKEAAKLGRNRSKSMRRDWDSAKLNVMRTALRAKVDQHEDVKELLLSTGTSKIEEDSPYDFFWGTGDDGSGKNWLGQLWMELRANLRGETEETDEEFVEAIFAGKTPRSLRPQVWSKRQGAPKAPKDAIYVGRPTKWGNPYSLKDERDRGEILRLYEEWLLSQPDIVAEVKRELKGKHLVCWCAPQACHADILLRIANED